MNILHLYRIYDSNFPFLFTLLKINTKKKKEKKIIPSLWELYER